MSPNHWPRTILRAGALLRALAAGLVVLAWAAPAGATDVQFPLGSRVGLVPPPGLVRQGAAPGFHDADHHVTLMMLELPPPAYEVVRSQMITENAKKNGIILDRRETLLTDAGALLLSAGEDTARGERKWMALGAMPGFVLLITAEIPDSAKALYPDESIHAALKTLTLRPPPVDEQLGLLPFKVTNLGGFRIAAVVNRQAVILTSGDPAKPHSSEQSHIMIGIGPSRPASPNDWPRIAEIAFGSVPGFVEQRITTSEPIRIDGTPAYELRATAKDAVTGQPVMIVQWLRFGASAFMQIVGVAAKENWERDFPNFRAVRDGVRPKS